MQLDRLLNAILRSAVETLGYDAATISARHNGTLTTIAATNQRLIALDEAQYHAGDGPCVTVLDQHEPVRLEQISADPRWEDFRTTAEHFGVTSSLSLHVPTEGLDDVAASLNLYGRNAPKPSEPGSDIARAMAEQIGMAMQAAEAHKVTASLADGLEQAMQSRAVIEQAKGIIIAQRGGTPDEAFERLKALSQHGNVKLRDLARRIVEEHAVSGDGRGPDGDGRAAETPPPAPAGADESTPTGF